VTVWGSGDVLFARDGLAGTDGSFSRRGASVRVRPAIEWTCSVVWSNVGVTGVRFAKSGGVSLAYQDFGSGPVTMVIILPFAQSIEIAWESPH
jgi:hypothetical protein